MWRDIPAQVNGQSGRDRHQVMLARALPAGDRPGQAQGAASSPHTRTSPSGAASASRATATPTSPPPPRPRRGVSRPSTPPNDWARSRFDAAASTNDAPCRVHAVGTVRRGRRRHHGARRRPPARCRPRHGVRRPRDLRSVPGGALARIVRQVGPDRRRARARPVDRGRGRLPRRTPARSGATSRLRGQRSTATWSIDIPPASQVHHQVVRKDLDLPPILVDPLFALYYVEITKADLESGSAASDLVTVALADQHGVTVTDVRPGGAPWPAPRHRRR